ncbi:MAG: hypothetical protein H7839_23340 [Magnetococcus sp. YQC-5]
MNRLVKYFLFGNLIMVAVLVFVYPHLMISPGNVLKGHRSFETDCFSCHDPFIGASSEKCVSCHNTKSIGVLTTKGVPLLEKKTKIPFHQKLLGKTCVSCHSDHSGVAKYRIEGRFSHQLLDDITRNQCIACHQRPVDPLHRSSTDQCTQCHGFEKWKPAQFKHDLLSAGQRESCAECHKAKTPTDSMHKQTSGKCGQCHTVTKWKPATFNHQKFFSFDKEHPERCNLCHPKTDYKSYTCYGCHEHSVEKIRREHLEEGIRNFEQCVLCHRNADKDQAEWLWKSGRWREGVSGSYQKPAEVGNLPELQQKRSRHNKNKDDD